MIFSTRTSTAVANPHASCVGLLEQLLDALDVGRVAVAGPQDLGVEGELGGGVDGLGQGVLDVRQVAHQGRVPVVELAQGAEVPVPQRAHQLGVRARPPASPHDTTVAPGTLESSGQPEMITVP